MSTSIPRVVLIWLAFGQLPPIALADANAVSRAQEALPVAQIYVEQERAPAAWMEAPGSWARLNSEIVELRQRVVELESRPADEHPLDQHLATPYATNGPQAWFPPASECVNCWERYPTLVINGFIQFDSAWFGESAASRMITGDIADVTAIRRARIAVSGDVRESVTYKLDVEVAGASSPSLRDVFLGFEDVPGVQNIRAGLFRAPFGLDALTSSRHFTFAERAPQFTFAPFRQLGVGAHGTHLAETVTWACSGYRFPTDGHGIALADGGYGLSTRVSLLPWQRGDQRGLLHIGGAHSVINPAGKVIRYEVRSSFFLAETAGGPAEVPPLLDTGYIPTNDINLFDAELAATLGPFHLQSELTYSLVDQIGGPPLAFYGAYAQVGWFLTGESRPYDRQAGVFTAIEPRADFTLHGGPGAWEIASRWSYTNLNDKNINGGQLNSIELVLNWYWSRRLKLKLLCSRVFVANTAMGDAELDIFGGRLQVVY